LVAKVETYIVLLGTLLRCTLVGADSCASYGVALGKSNALYWLVVELGEIKVINDGFEVDGLCCINWTCL